ncbi:MULTISPECIES: hypothetical protein [Moorena]|nr:MULTISPECIES: hypothetical protein [Moorena]NEP66196.1 hypothetical protein [Moorena sp. SIO3A5]NES45675.1 hypothetical protein [Moorena sp. SIO2C4]
MLIFPRVCSRSGSSRASHLSHWRCAIALWGMLLVITRFRGTDPEPNGSPWWLSVTGNPSN